MNSDIGHLSILIVLSILTCSRFVGAGWIDIDTPLNKRTTESLVDGTTYHLVMSDEFNVDGRTFEDGHDPMWTALDKSDDDASSAGGGSMQFYNSSAVTTKDGMLKISTYLETTKWNHYDILKKEWKHIQTNFTSGMMQSWNKFCFTGGIVEIDVIFPGDPQIGGLWPAVWMLGNLGRATYEASTNNIWPWSFDKCDYSLQDAQSISACNRENHYGMHPFQGRGSTEIDIVEVMTGSSRKPFKVTDPPISLPYADFTLQTAPGVLLNRPQGGSLPVKRDIVTKGGYTRLFAETWYDGLEKNGDTSFNPFFYGTYLAETKKEEPVSRNKKQAFQADAIGVVHQLNPSHFVKPHKIRVEWQPGTGGRVDWFVKNSNWTQGDDVGREWIRAFTIHDKSLSDLMGSKIPNEPSYLIMNTAVSSTWGFPTDVPDGCPKCYDCNDPKCACRFNPGFCEMLRSRDAAMYIDSIRVYQSRDDSAHVGSPHTLGCDPPDYPTKDWIEGHTSRYMRSPPFSNKDLGPLRKIQKGGGKCVADSGCGGTVESVNLTAVQEGNLTFDNATIKGRGLCVPSLQHAMFSIVGGRSVCSCKDGFTGPHCMALANWGDHPSAHETYTPASPFLNVARASPSPVLAVILIALSILFFGIVIFAVREEKLSRYESHKIAMNHSAIAMNSFT